MTTTKKPRPTKKVTTSTILPSTVTELADEVTTAYLDSAIDYNDKNRKYSCKDLKLSKDSKTALTFHLDGV